MRYRVDEAGVAIPAESSGDIVLATVWFTLLIGILFLVAGVRGRQPWLQFWGGLTCICCALYFARDWLGLGRLFGL